MPKRQFIGKSEFLNKRLMLMAQKEIMNAFNKHLN
jgi:hypothetical protein